MQLTQGFSLRQSLSQSLQLTQEQRIVLQQLSFSLRLDLIQALWGQRYEPRGTCPGCDRKLTAVEIIKGFNQDPNDFTTGCSACGRRFEPSLICFGDGVEIRLPFYCDVQALEKLKGRELLLPERISKELPGVYRSAIIHHGSLRRAFEKLGINYQFEEINDWKTKIQPFLGRLQDTVIAECVDAPVSAIRALRKKLGIPKYSLAAALEEAEKAGVEA